MGRLTIILPALFVSFIAQAQLPVNFRPLRYDDDFSVLKNDTIPDLYSKLKYMPLGNEKYYLSFGGEARLQYINTINNKWGDDSDGYSGYLLSRFLFHTDFHAGRFRLFGQLQSSIATGLDDESPVDDNSIDIHQAFADVSILKEKPESLILRAGRQEMLYGSQRLISVREGPNSRIAMDGIKLFYKSNIVKSDLFYTHPVQNSKGIFNDNFNENAKLWGSYTVLNNFPYLNNIDVYYIGLWKKEATFDNAAGKETRHSVGFRIWDSKDLWHYDIEALYQFGMLDKQTISAWTVSSYINYKAENLKYKPVFGLKTEAISGDKSTTDNKLQTFNPLYPRGAYFGLVAQIGPANLFDIHPSIDFEINEKWSLGIDYDIFWRWSVNDGIYAPNMQLLYSTEGTSESFIGTQLSANAEYNPNPFLSFSLESAWFNAGAFLKEAGTGKDYFYAALTGRVRF